MPASVESQRLISLSLGKIAQSRGQRGGINLHKNLLVATVLHKARAAYMMETYNYQCQQKTAEQQQQQQQVEVSSTQADLSCSESAESVSCQQQQPACSPSSQMDVGQPATPIASEGENRSTVSVSAPEESEVSDKENFLPPEASPVEGNDSSSEHLAAAAQLAQDAMISDGHSSKQQTSGVPTCNGILKRRRDNPNALLVEDSPAVKKAKVVSSDGAFSPPSQLPVRPQSPCQFTPLNSSDNSSDESSDYESDSEVSMNTDSPQISNLVSIFNSGFAGLCANNNGSDQDKFTSLANLRSEASSPSPASFSRKLSEPSLMCSSEVGRLDSLPSAIVLSA